MYFFQLIAIAGSVVLFAVVIDFIRRGLLKEKYSVLWLALCTVILALSVKRGLLDWFAGLFGVAYPPSLLFLAILFFVLLMLMHFSVVISLLHERNKTLSQEITLLKHEIKKLKDPVPPDKKP